MVDVLIKWAIFGMALLSFIYAMGQFAVKDKKSLNYIIGAMYCCFSIISLHFGLEFTDYLFQCPHVIQINIPFIFASGPLVFFYFQYIFNSNYRISGKSLAHFLPSLISVVALLPFYLKSGHEKAFIYGNPTGGYLFFSVSYISYRKSPLWFTRLS